MVSRGAELGIEVKEGVSVEGASVRQRRFIFRLLSMAGAGFGVGGRGTEAVSLCASLSDSANFRKESTNQFPGTRHGQSYRLWNTKGRRAL